ncbi:MAG: hypothetical protein J0L99_09650 [Chitinophagales bacterium]|nr:hypothetical protein [Chitinophagales bacterium]
MERMKYPAVHWVDGMKISKREFSALENYLMDQLRDALSVTLTDYNYGLLPAPETGRDALSVEVSAERIELNYCRAVTRAGARIEVIDQDHQALRRSVKEMMGNFDFSHAQEWYVALKVDAFTRVPFGEISMDTHRQLYTIPQYEIIIIPKEQSPSGQFAPFAIPIAKLRNSVGGVEQIKNYIPPCTSLRVSPELLRIHQRIEQDLSEVLRKATIIVRKVNYRNQREKITALAADIAQVAQQTMTFLNQHYDTYRLILPHQPPLLFIEYFARFARTVDTSLELTRGKDDMLNYFQQYVQNFNYNEFSTSIQHMTSALMYNHLEIRQSLDRVENLIAHVKNLFEGLDRLNYEQLPQFDIIVNVQPWQQNQGGNRLNPNQQMPVPPPIQAPGGGKVKINPRGRDGNPGGGGQDPNNPFGFNE